MKNLKLNTLALSTVAAFGLATTPAFAESEFRQHGAHVHGEVEFNVAQDGNELLIEIEAPGADVVGFEHAPKTEQEKTALKQAIAKLEQPTSLFTLTANANCAIEHVSVTHTLGEDSHDEHKHDDHGHVEHKHHDHGHDEHKHDDHGHDEHKHDDHGHDEHKHDDHGHDEHKHDDHGHDKHKHDDHGHDEHKHHDHDHDHGGHGEFVVEYHFSCENMDKLTQVETQWFNNFEQTEKISVNILTDRVQGSATLDANNTRFGL